MLKDLKLSERKPVFVDTETAFLYSGIRLVQVYQEGMDAAVLIDTREVELRSVYEMLKNMHVVFHNFCYDAACFANDLNLKENPFKNFDDTLLLSRQAFVSELEMFSLDKCFEYVYGYDVYEGFEKKELQRSFLSTKKRDGLFCDLTQRQLDYAATDVFYMPKLWNAVKDFRDSFAYALDKAFIHHIYSWQYWGMPVNKNTLEKTKENLLAKLEAIKAELPEGLNVNSVSQVRELTRLSKTGKLELKLAKRAGNKEAGLVVDARSIIKRLNFCDRYSFDRVKGYFSPTAVSGRIRCSGSDKEGENSDNIVQIPRDLKEVFGFTEECSKYLVYCDFASLELRTIAAQTGCPVLTNLFKDPAVDLHSYTARKIFGEGFSKEDRLTAKMANFGLLYLCSAQTFLSVFDLLAGDDLEPLTLKKAEFLKNAWLDTYPGIKKWHAEVKNLFFNKKQRVFETLNGRKFKAKMTTDVAGVTNQALGADCAKLSAIYLFKLVPNVKLLNFMHDSLTLEADNLEHAKYLAEQLGIAMTVGWFEGIKNAKEPKIPMPLEVSVAKNWKDCDANPVFSLKAGGAWEEVSYLWEKLNFLK